MSRKEFERAAVLKRVEAGEVSLKAAARLLDLSYRQAKRLYKRFREEGPPGLVHRSVGRGSNHARSAEERRRVLELVREHYGGLAERGPGQRFGPTLTAEHLWEDHGIRVPATTLRDWMLEAGLWSRVRRSGRKPKRRERRAHFGELVQLDGSFHDWFEGRGERAGRRSCMMSMVDDATGKTLVRFGEEETTWAAADILKAWIERYGVPRALYTDWRNVYKRQPTSAEEAAGEEGFTQFGRMCAKLGIRIIAAGTPLGIGDDAEANAYCESEYLVQHNARYSVAPASPVDYHLPRDPSLRDADVFCLEHARKAGNDFVVQFRRHGLQLDRKARGWVPAGSKVIVREGRDGSLRVIHIDRRGNERECRWTPAATRTQARPNTLPSPEPVQQQQRPRPNRDHPWRARGTLRATPPDRGGVAT